MISFKYHRICKALFIAVLLFMTASQAATAQITKGLIATEIVKALLVSMRLSTEVTFGSITADDRFGTFSVSDLRIRTPIGVIEFKEIISSSLPIPVGSELVVGGSIEIIGFNYVIRSSNLPYEFVAQSRELGFEKFSGDIIIQYSYDLGSSKLDLSANIALNGAGEILVDTSIRDIYLLSGLNDLTKVVADPFGNLDSDFHANLKSLNVSFFDKGITEKAINSYAQNREKSPAQIRRQIPKMIGEILSLEAGKGGKPSNSPTIANITKEVQKFFTDPNSISLSIMPDEPINVSELGDALKALDLETAGVVLIANQPYSGQLRVQETEGEEKENVKSTAQGLSYLRGIGVPQNFSKATKLIPDAKLMDDPEALYLVARIQADGIGLKKNLKKAYELALLSGAKGYSKVSNLLNQIEVELTSADVAKIQEATYKKWLTSKDAQFMKVKKKAADNGDLISIRALARAFFKGMNVPRNYVLAYAWSSIAAAAGDPIARSVRDRLIYSTGKKRVLDNKQILQAQEIAGELWTKGIGKALRGGK